MKKAKSKGGGKIKGQELINDLIFLGESLSFWELKKAHGHPEGEKKQKKIIKKMKKHFK